MTQPPKPALPCADELRDALQNLFDACRHYDPDDWRGEPAMCRAHELLNALPARAEPKPDRVDIEGEFAASLRTPEPPAAERLEGAVDRAAVKWCGQKDRETGLDDIRYFRANWKSLPGLKAYVDAELATPAPTEPSAEDQVLRNLDGPYLTPSPDIIRDALQKAARWFRGHSAISNREMAELMEAALAAARMTEADVMREWNWGNLTKLGLANFLRRTGLNAEAAIRKAEQIAPALAASNVASGEVVELKQRMIAFEDAINEPRALPNPEPMEVRDYRHWLYPKWEALCRDIQALAALPTRDAIRAEAIEECAVKAASVFKGHGKTFRTERAHNYEHAGKKIAAAIRNLAQGGM